MSQTWSHLKGDARAVHEIVDNNAHQSREALSSVLRIAGGCNPPIFSAKAKGLFETGCATDTVLRESDSMPIPGFLERRHYAAGKLHRFRDQHVQRFSIEITVPVDFAQVPVVQLFLQDEVDIPLTYFEMTHSLSQMIE
jgi:hypothetical protein